MTATDIINEVSAAHRIEASDLAASLTKAGWDFSSFTGTAAEISFIRKAVANVAGQMTARRDRIEATRVQMAALRDRRLTKAARANPAAQCGKCDGGGRILAFSHISGGSCFQCGGSGVIRLRAA